MEKKEEGMKKEKKKKKKKKKKKEWRRRRNEEEDAEKEKREWSRKINEKHKEAKEENKRTIKTLQTFIYHFIVINNQIPCYNCCQFDAHLFTCFTCRPWWRSLSWQKTNEVIFTYIYVSVSFIYKMKPLCKESKLILWFQFCYLKVVMFKFNEIRQCHIVPVNLYTCTSFPHN